MKHLMIACIFLAFFVMQSCKKSNPGPVVTPTPSSSKLITSFLFKSSDNPGLTGDFAGVISNDTIYVSIPYPNSIISLKPVIQHSGISLTPGSGTTQSFTNPVMYNVKAADGSSKPYLVITKITTKSTVYTGSADGKLYAFDGDNGNLKWTYNTGGVITLSSPTYFNGTIFIGSADGFLHAVDAVSGVLKWKYDAHGSTSGSTPVLNNGILYFGSSASPSYLTALNAVTGTMIWEKTTFETFLFPTFYNNTLFVGGINGLHKFSALDGSYLSTINIDITRGNPLIFNDVLFVPAESPVVKAFNANTGALKWSYSDPGFGNGSRGGPTQFNGTVFNMGHAGYMYAINSETGALRWKYPEGTVGAGQFSSATVANGLVYACNSSSYLHAIDAATGKLLWKFSDGIVGSGPVTNGNNCTVKDDIVYFGNYSNKLYAINALTGAVKWQYATGGMISGGACVVAENGAVYHSGVSGEHQ